MNKSRKNFQVGDFITYKKKKYMVAHTEGWWLIEGWIDVIDEFGSSALLLSNEDLNNKVKLLMSRNDVKRYWEFLPIRK